MAKPKRFAAQELDLSSRHSIKIRPGGQEDPAGGLPCRVVADYFFHEGEFWTASVPLKEVKDVFGQAFNFSKPKIKKGPDGPSIVFGKDGVPKRTIPVLNHVQCRFVLNPGASVELFPMGGQPAGEPVHRISDFVYSIEAVGPVGVRFNLKDGMLGTLASAHRFLSTREMVFERIVVGGQYVTETPALPLADSEKSELLWRSLKRGDQAGMDETYYLYRCCGTNNCTSNPFQILDQVVRYSPAKRLGSFLYRLPLSPRFYLRVRGLDSDPAVRKLVREEFASYIQSPDTRQRKRDYVRRQVRAIREARDDGAAVG